MVVIDDDVWISTSLLFEVVEGGKNTSPTTRMPSAGPVSRPFLNFRTSPALPS
jgi:hypothetical protein